MTKSYAPEKLGTKLGGKKERGGETVSKIKTTDKRKVQSKTESGQRTAETEIGTLTVRMRKKYSRNKYVIWSKTEKTTPQDDDSF